MFQILLQNGITNIDGITGRNVSLTLQINLNSLFTKTGSQNYVSEFKYKYNGYLYQPPNLDIQLYFQKTKLYTFKY